MTPVTGSAATAPLDPPGDPRPPGRARPDHLGGCRSGHGYNCGLTSKIAIRLPDQVLATARQASLGASSSRPLLMPGVTLDTGALIAIGPPDRRMRALLDGAHAKAAGILSVWTTRDQRTDRRKRGAQRPAPRPGRHHQRPG